MKQEAIGGEGQFRVKRVLNNNAVIAYDGQGREVVALGRGLGHGLKPGTLFSEELVDQRFLSGEDVVASQLAAFLETIPAPFLRVADDIAERAGEQLGIRVTQALILPLADHLHFAAQRVAEGVAIEVPLAWEVAHLYPQEIRLGAEGVRLARASLGIDFAAGEAVAIAMHLVNAQFASEGVAKTVRMTEIISQAFDVIESSFGLKIDQTSMGAARFVTHLRYLTARIHSGRLIEDAPRRFVDIISDEYPEAMTCAQRIQYLFDLGMGAELSMQERAYLALHVMRIVKDSRAAA